MGKGRDAAQYPPLRQVRDTLKVKWYRCPMPKGTLSQLSKRSDAQGLFQAVGHLAMWVATGCAVRHCWHSQLYLSAAIAMFFHGTLGSCFGYAVHELGHGTVFATKWLNKFFLVVYSLPLWWDPYDCECVLARLYCPPAARSFFSDILNLASCRRVLAHLSSPVQPIPRG